MILNKDEFEMETLGGDASLLHLAQQIDAGIRKKMRSIESDRAKKLRLWHHRLLPFKFICLFGYILLSQFEKPRWCLKIIRKINEDPEYYPDFDKTTCNDSKESYGDF